MRCPTFALNQGHEKYLCSTSDCSYQYFYAGHVDRPTERIDFFEYEVPQRPFGFWISSDHSSSQPRIRHRGAQGRCLKMVFLFFGNCPLCNF